MRVTRIIEMPELETSQRHNPVFIPSIYTGRTARMSALLRTPIPVEIVVGQFDLDIAEVNMRVF